MGDCVLWEWEGVWDPEALTVHQVTAGNSPSGLSRKQLLDDTWHGVRIIWIRGVLRRSPDGGSMSGQRRRRWPDIDPASGSAIGSTMGLCPTHWPVIDPMLEFYSIVGVGDKRLNLRLIASDVCYAEGNVCVNIFKYLITYGGRLQSPPPPFNKEFSFIQCGPAFLDTRVMCIVVTCLGHCYNYLPCVQVSRI